MLQRLRVRGFKSLVDVEVELAPLVVLFGPNAAGKSNFLEALSLLSRLVTEPTVSKALDPPLRGYPLEAFSVPLEGLPGLLSQEQVRLSLDAHIETRVRKAVRHLHYRVALSMEPTTGGVSVTDEYLARVDPQGQLSRWKPRIERDGDELVVRQLKGDLRREQLGLNHTQVSNRQLAGENRCPDLDQLREELSSWQTYYLDPRVAMREPQPPREVHHIGTQGRWLAPFLYRLKVDPETRRHFQAIGRALHAAIPTVDSLDVDLDPRRGNLDIIVRQNGTPYSSRVVSEGTLRVLALCAIAANPWPGELVAFEEPENGVHPRRIEVIANLLGQMVDRGQSQVVVTTHSPTFVAAMLQKHREAPEKIRLLRVSQHGRETRIQPLDSTLPIFEDSTIRDALQGSEDPDLFILQDMLLRGWI